MTKETNKLFVTHQVKSLKYLQEKTNGTVSVSLYRWKLKYAVTRKGTGLARAEFLMQGRQRF